jgi:hypothetical protein
MDNSNKEADIKTLLNVAKIFNLNKNKIADAIKKINEGNKNEQK